MEEDNAKVGTEMHAGSVILASVHQIGAYYRLGLIFETLFGRWLEVENHRCWHMRIARSTYWMLQSQVS